MFINNIKMLYQINCTKRLPALNIKTNKQNNKMLPDLGTDTLHLSHA